MICMKTRLFMEVSFIKLYPNIYQFNRTLFEDIRPENFHFVTDDLDSDLKLTNFKMATKTNTRLVDPKIVKKW